MTANDDTPPSGENVSDESVDYQSIGQTLLRGELERVGYAVRDEFQQLSMKVERGGDLDESDVSQLRAALDEAAQLVDLIEKEGLDDE